MIKGLILAGGQSRRFGSDKASALYEGEPFLLRSVNVLKCLKFKPVIMTRPGASYFFSETETYYDEHPEKGPLGGIYTAMHLFPETDFLTLTCDMPLLNKKILKNLINQYQKNFLATFYRSEGSDCEPFPGIYPFAAFSEISQRLFAGKLAMRGLIESLPKKNVIQFQGDKRELMNVNYSADLEKLVS